MVMTTTLLLAVLSVQAPEATRTSVTGGPTHADKSSLRVSPAPKRGVGMLVTGSILTVAGTALMLAIPFAFAAKARCERSGNGECWDLIAAAAEFPFGVVGLAVGVPLLVVGVRRNRAWREWQEAHNLTLRPQIDRRRGSWALGFELRF